MFPRARVKTPQIALLSSEPPTVGSLDRLALTRGFLFSRFFCWFGRNWFSDVALNEQLGGGIIDVQNELLLKLHQLDRLTDLRAFWD